MTYGLKTVKEMKAQHSKERKELAQKHKRQLDNLKTMRTAMRYNTRKSAHTRRRKK